MKEPKGKVLFNSILISLDMETHSKGGIKIPEGSQKAYTDQKVIKVGTNVEEVDKGIYVEVNPAVFQKGLPILELEGEQYGLISVRDIMYVYDKDYIPSRLMDKELKA